MRRDLRTVVSTLQTSQDTNGPDSKLFNKKPNSQGTLEGFLKMKEERSKGEKDEK
jgi:hypothetical protein